MFRGTFDFEARPFDWGAGYQRPNIPLKDLVIAELPVRLFTGGCSMSRWAGLAIAEGAAGLGGSLRRCPSAFPLVGVSPVF